MEKKENFLDYCRYMRGHSEETLKTYNFVFAKFEKFVSGKDDWVTTQNIVDYLMSLKKENLSIATINLHRAALMSYFRWCCQFAGLKNNPVAIVAPLKNPPKMLGTISEQEMNEIISNMKEDTITEVRDKLIVTILYHCGLRVAELQKLTFQDIDLPNQTFIVHGKGNKDRIVPFSDLVRQLLEEFKIMRDSFDYINYKNYCKSLISNTDDLQPLDTAQIRYIVKKHLLPFVRPDKAHPHALRHAYATTLLSHGMGIESIAKLMGHSSIATTMVYLSFSMEKIHNLYNKIF